MFTVGRCTCTDARSSCSFGEFLEHTNLQGPHPFFGLGAFLGGFPLLCAIASLNFAAGILVVSP